MSDTCAECEYAAEHDTNRQLLVCHGMPPGDRETLVTPNRKACSLFRLHWEYDYNLDPF